MVEPRWARRQPLDAVRQCGCVKANSDTRRIAVDAFYFGTLVVLAYLSGKRGLRLFAQGGAPYSLYR